MAAAREQSDVVFISSGAACLCCVGPGDYPWPSENTGPAIFTVKPAEVTIVPARLVPHKGIIQAPSTVLCFELSGTEVNKRD